ncbi:MULTISPECIES: HTH-type sugar sensing transcriptional regulator TrmB [unclassified Haladaptatus]|uniref:HTH-type sugar sensing transcriptional regulator TrmB n=1 Tax=unclassified Haladaptatus TaxID=2622732 RepID=UPI0023E86793|nr:MULTISPECIES: TrmB family transcriptional regulator [unclassified Haladaptatus]
MTTDLYRSLEALSSRFSFGEYETRAYLTILEHGEVTASEISEYTDIPQPRVYDTVRTLSDHGLVELQETRPLRVLAIDPEEAFADYRTSLESVVTGLEDLYTAPKRQTEAASLVKSSATINRYLEDVIQTAEYELILSLSPDLLATFEDALAAKIDDGVTIDLLLSPSRELPSAESYDYNSVATTVQARSGITTPIIAVADGNYSVYAPREALTDGQDADRYGVIFNRSALGFLVSGFFNTLLWTTAEPVAEQAEDRPFPRRYATIRRCVSDLLGRDETFYATIRGRDVESGKSRLVEGTVVEASFGDSRKTAHLVVETADGPVEVGGQVAALEDVEAHEIHVDRENA